MFELEYTRKLRIPGEAVKVMRSGDWLDYVFFYGEPKALDKAFDRRKDELIKEAERPGFWKRSNKIEP